MERVSVLIPNYNHGPFLMERIDTVLAQNGVDYDVVILDDASTDNSREVIQRYVGHPKIKKIIFNEINGGSALRQWKRGVSHCDGDLVWIAESDDFCDPDYLKSMVLEYRAHGCDITYCDSFVVDENSDIVDVWYYGSSFFSSDRWKESYVNDGLDELKNYLLHQNTIPNASACLFSKSSLVDALNGVDNFSLLADWAVYCEILKKGSVRFIQKRMNYFREHPRTTRTHSKPEINRRFHELDRIRKRLFELKITDSEPSRSDVESPMKVLMNCDKFTDQLSDFIGDYGAVGVFGNSHLSRLIISRLESSVRRKIHWIADRRVESVGWKFMGIPIVCSSCVSVDFFDVDAALILSVNSAEIIRESIQSMMRNGHVFKPIQTLSFTC